MKPLAPAVFVIVLIAVVLPRAGQAAPSCWVVPETPGQAAQFRDADKKVWKVPPAAEVKNCSHLSVSSGRILLIFEPPIAGKGFVSCGPGEAECPALEGPRTSEGSRASKALALAKGMPEQRPGGRRYDEDARRLEGLPSGKIYSLERAGIFDFRALGTASWSLVVTREPGRAAIFQKSGSDPVVQLPRTLFQRGGKYGWTLNAGGKRFTGGFDVLGPSPAAEVERDLREAGVTPGPRTRKQQIEELMVLFDHDLDHEVRILYRELGL